MAAESARKSAIIERSAQHSTFVIERRYDFAPARVFAAWATLEAKRRWFVGPEAWKKSDHKLDFRVGGRETVSGGPPGGTVHKYAAVYHDIVPNQRIVTTYDMHMDDVKTSVSVATVVFRDVGKGTLLVYTEQGVFLDGHDNPAERERGTHALLDNLAAELERKS